MDRSIEWSRGAGRAAFQHRHMTINEVRAADFSPANQGSDSRTHRAYEEALTERRAGVDRLPRPMATLGVGTGTVQRIKAEMSA